MNELIKEFNDTGDCVLEILKVAEKWDNTFWLSKYDEIFQLVVNGDIDKEIIGLKVQISNIQANKLIYELGLIESKDSTFRLASAFHKRDFYCTEITRLNELLRVRTGLEFRESNQYAKGYIVRYLELI